MIEGCAVLILVDISIYGMEGESPVFSFFYKTEDVINQEIVDFLEGQGVAFVPKLTPYNNWWKL